MPVQAAERGRQSPLQGAETAPLLPSRLKDMDAIAELCAYPLAVNGEVIETREAFMELGADVIFTEERCAVIEAVDVSALEDTMAGVIMGDGTPNIIFKSVDGELGITGIN